MPLGQFLVEGVIYDAKIGTRRFDQTVGHFVRSFGPLPIRDVDKNRIDERVSDTFPGARMNARRRVIGINSFRRIAIIQVSDDVGGIYNNNAIIDQDRDFDASINVLKCRVV